MTEIVEPIPPPLPLKVNTTGPSMYVPLSGPVMMEESPSDLTYDGITTWRKAPEYGR